MKVVGLDLAGMPKNGSGYCLLSVDKSKTVSCSILHSDEEILEHISSDSPDLIAVDAPLIYDGESRVCDNLLNEYGVLPVTLSGMSKLAVRGSHLYSLFFGDAIEVSVRASSKILGVYAKDDFNMQKMVMGLDLCGDITQRILYRDEIDSIVAAITGYLYLEGLTEEIGDIRGKIIVPKI